MKTFTSHPRRRMAIRIRCRKWLRSHQPAWAAPFGLSRWLPVALAYRRPWPLRTATASVAVTPNQTPAYSTAAVQPAAAWHFHAHPIVARRVYRTTVFVERVVAGWQPSSSHTQTGERYTVATSLTAQHRHRWLIGHGKTQPPITIGLCGPIFVGRRPVDASSAGVSWPNGHRRALWRVAMSGSRSDSWLAAPAPRPIPLVPVHAVPTQSPLEHYPLVSTQPRSPLIVHRLQRRMTSTAPAVVEEVESLLASRQQAASLVWRRTQAADDRNETPARPSIHQTRASVRTDRSNDPPSPAAMTAVRSATSAPAAALKLDGPAIDRLTEDVIERIDRRMRIERERRGL